MSKHTEEIKSLKRTKERLFRTKSNIKTEQTKKISLLFKNFTPKNPKQEKPLKKQI